MIYLVRAFKASRACHEESKNGAALPVLAKPPAAVWHEIIYSLAAFIFPGLAPRIAREARQ